jgi:hypothetical protein
VFVVRPDGLDHEVELVGAVDLPGDAVILAWRDGAGFGEVIEPVDPSCGVIFHDEYNTASALRPREQNETIGAEVEHGMRAGESARSGSAKAPAASLAAPLWG